MPNQTVFALVIFLHDLFTAVWIGGLITLGVTVLPSVKRCWGWDLKPNSSWIPSRSD